ncbi:pectate lyase [Hufsiella ginkgonis]|uniref:Pectate lyase n=1 Tax=Hufsiella ginkgonis TaxID=2695274 RepID=A0A7K1XSV7_9SPHI|nr:pectate lyase [Hufsiella ginkgonis]MXV14081.1 pectate lyase [Hufsiella ginkgonis]
MNICKPRSDAAAYVRIALLTAGILLTGKVFSQGQSPGRIDPGPFADNAHHWYDIYDKEAAIHPREGRPKHAPTNLEAIGDNIVLLQKENGGWPKNYDIMAILTPAQKDSLAKVKNKLNTTYDNGSTFSHIAALAVVYNALKRDKYKTAALKGLGFVLASQYANGGWPQYFPLQDNYSRNVTYNDGNFTGIMSLLKNIAGDKPDFAFVDNSYREKVKAAYAKGLACIIKTQINDAGSPTAWCQQYDEVTLQPSWARKFEPPSICNQESADLVLFLMSIERPGKALISAIQHAVAWFNESKIYHTRVTTISAPREVSAFRVSVTDKVVVADDNAPPIWTRYYELKTHKPIFCDRDSKIVYTLAEVSRERRDGYAWYTYGPQRVLDSYEAWQKRVGAN